MNLKKYIPRDTPEKVALCAFIVLSHAVTLFELFVVLPFVYRHHEKNISYYLHILFGLFLYVNFVSNLVKFIITENGTAGMMLPTILKEGWHFCSVCECNAPPRSFHCTFCDKCVLKRDHHCTFTGNCVGFANQRYYMHMLVYLFVGALYANFLNFDYAYHTLHGLSFKTLFLMALPMFAWLLNFSEGVTVGSAFMTSLCIIVCLLSAVLLFYHFKLVLKGQTGHEGNAKWTHYDLGWEKNLVMSFGKNWRYCWLSPFIKSPLIGDGTFFPDKDLFEATKDL